MGSHFIIMHLVRNIFGGIFLKTEACEGGCLVCRVILHQGDYGTLYSCFALKSQDMIK
jgi:ferredoxin